LALSLFQLAGFRHLRLAAGIRDRVTAAGIGKPHIGRLAVGALLGDPFVITDFQYWRRTAGKAARVARARRHRRPDRGCQHRERCVMAF